MWVEFGDSRAVWESRASYRGAIVWVQKNKGTWLQILGRETVSRSSL